ncbi:MAG: hypothetical protein AAGA36_00385 [Pseudomonadota bacterium]
MSDAVDVLLVLVGFMAPAVAAWLMYRAGRAYECSLRNMTYHRIKSTRSRANKFLMWGILATLFSTVIWKVL